MAAEGKEHYSGTDCYRFIDPLIRGKGRELMIVSPYIGNHYTRMLLRESRRKRVRIITSEGTVGYKGSMLKDIHGRALGGHLRYVLYFAVLDAIVIYLKFFYIAAAISALLALVLLSFFLRARKADRNIGVKTTGEEFVHEKLYIADGIAIVGSANLTFSGTHKNLEHIEAIRDKKEIEELKAHFSALWGRY